MPMNEVLASDEIFSVLDAAQDYGDAGAPQIAEARAQLRVVANAFAKCIPHLMAGTVSTTDTGVVAGAVVSPPSPGTFTGTGSGGVLGLVQGDALTGVGLAGAIMAVLHAGQTYLPGADVAAARAELAKLANACALFATYVMANALVSTTVTGPAITPGLNGPATGVGTGTVT